MKQADWVVANLEGLVSRFAKVSLTFVFTIVWFVGSILASPWFAFVLWPRIYQLRTSVLVPVYFRTADGDKVVYFPNTPTQNTLSHP